MVRKIAWAIVGIGVAVVGFGKSGVSDTSLGILLAAGACVGVLYSIVLDRFKAQTNKIIWLTLAISTFVFMFFGPDAKLVSYYGIMLFSFPVSLIVDGVNYVAFPMPINDFMPLFWVAAFVLGYLQWFVLVPRIKSRHAVKNKYF
ncbi:hypothetical protein [Bdellovibrio bacteriovorus]|uniref:hypothetical protein n=1 Tax=Bdellovibrio bacteriovorus TaxID=959 RepID=UPI0005A26BDC|nr:hypothetical protein [Bdellovibrio bacteriovorus]